MKKRILSLVLVLAMSVGMMACGSKGETLVDPTPTTAAGTENTKAKNNVHLIRYERLFWMKLSLKKLEELHTMPEQRLKNSQNL